MLGLSIIFLIFALIIGYKGLRGVAIFSMEISRFLFTLFLIIFIILLILGLGLIFTESPQPKIKQNDKISPASA